jgi:hypothetical protein
MMGLQKSRPLCTYLSVMRKIQKYNVIKVLKDGSHCLCLWYPTSLCGRWQLNSLPEVPCRCLCQNSGCPKMAHYISLSIQVNNGDNFMSICCLVIYYRHLEEISASMFRNVEEELCCGHGVLSQKTMLRKPQIIQLRISYLSAGYGLYKTFANYLQTPFHSPLNSRSISYGIVHSSVVYASGIQPFLFAYPQI